MNKLKVLLFSLCAMLSSCADRELEIKLKDVLEDAVRTYGMKAIEVEKARVAAPFAFANGEEIMADGENSWAGGYFIGSLWLLSQWGEDAILQESADVLTYRYKEPKGIDISELTAVVNVAHYKGYNITKNPRYEEILGMVTRLMSNSFYKVPTYRMTKPVEGEPSTYHRVTINYMPAIECFHGIGWGQNNVIHGNAVKKYLCREDGSVNEGVILDMSNPSWRKAFSVYGENAESAWARGQAWALYGYTMLYRLTEDDAFLKQSKKIAGYIMKNLPADVIPNWDFASEKQQKDSSAAAIMASAFIDLYGLTGDVSYLQVAEQQLTTLSSDEYLAKADECGGFMLKHGVENYPQSKLVDASLVYGDYYFIEAMIRYLNR